jgi:hypothetical protein
VTDGEEGNDPVASGDVTVMRIASKKVRAVVGVAALVASMGATVSQGTALAEPAGHRVTYTVTSADSYDFELMYLTVQPANMAAYNADAYTYLKKEDVTLAPGVPWVVDATLADAQWAFLSVSSTAHGGKAPPNAHCEIAVDGVVAAQQDNPYSPRCQLGQW